MNIFAFLSLLSTIFITTIGIVVFLNSSRNSNTFLFLLLTIAVALLNLSQFQMRLASDSFEALIWSKLYSVWPFALAISVHFVTELNRNIRRPKQFRLLVYLPACILTYIQFSTQLIALPPIEKYWGWSIEYKMGPINYIAIVAGVTYWLTILTTLLLYNKKLTGKPKKQSKIIFLRCLLN